MTRKFKSFFSSSHAIPGKRFSSRCPNEALLHHYSQRKCSTASLPKGLKRSWALFFYLLLTGSLAANALERTSLLPADAQAYVRVSNTTSFWSQLKKSSIGKLWADRQFQDVLGNPDTETWQDLFFDGESDVEDEVLVDQLKMLTGEVILAFSPEMEDPYIIAAMGSDDFTRSLEMDAKLIEVAGKPFEIVKGTFQDVEIIRHIENGGGPEEKSSWQAHVGTTFVMGQTREWVERCIVQLKKEAVKEPEGNPVCNLNLPLSAMIRKYVEAGKKSAVDNPGSVDIELLFEALGLMGLENYSLQLELKESEMVADSHLRASDLHKGIFTMLDMEPSELPGVDFIPENIASIEVGRFNLLRFWQEIPTVLATAMPAVKPQFDMILAMIQQQAGILFEQDLLAHIGTEYFSFSVAEGTKETSVMAVELKNTMAFRTGLETALAAPSLQPRVAAGLNIEAFLEHTIYTVKNADPENAIAFAVAGDYLLYGHPDGIRQVIRSESSETETKSSFERSALIKGLRQYVPSRAFGFGAVDWKKHMGAMVHELGKPEYTRVIVQNWAKSGSPLPPPDFSKLPPADHIASFFNVSYQYAEATGDGIHQQIILKY